MPGVYLSYPFCAQKCSYCNFASGVQPRDLEPRYIGALSAELDAMQWPWVPETVYLGGGTPSRMDPRDLAGLLALIPGNPWQEATIEAAPGSITRAKAEAWVEAWRDAGINRVSLGVQSFIQRELARTGRTHTAEIVASEIATLREVGLSNFNIDLIAGLPGQTLDSWNASLDWIARLEPPHVSVYMLEVDQDSRLGAEVLALGKRYGAGDVPSDDAIADFYEIAVERLASLGIPRYEISNFARAGFESRHNLKYWRREPYLGFGADAHSFDGWVDKGVDQGVRWQNAESAADYVALFEQGASQVVARTAADPGERFFLGLRLNEGVEADWSPYAPAVEEFARQGLLEIDGKRLRLTPGGVLLSNEVFAEFI
jgi:oxygen-independent coproporphyrinogen-3 oxidase